MTGINNRIITRYAASFVDELSRAGIHDVVISPGSRSTPLALLFEEHSRIKVWMQIDERSAGFFGLGMAKSQRKPVALLCTSGTAAANYLPAVVEAYYSRVPLLVLTADRPHELRDLGAPQAINQIDLYGKFAKWFVDMPLPESQPAMLNYVRTTAQRAAALAAVDPMGPVHLNFPFREPLLPDLSLEDLWSGGRKGEQSYVQVRSGENHLDPADLGRLARELAGIERGIIICGPEDNPPLVPVLVRLADKLKFPLLADPLSQFRSGSGVKDAVIDSYDAFLRHEPTTRTLEPEVILKFGAMPVSKSLFLYLKAYPQAKQIVIDNHLGWREPSLSASVMVSSDPVHFCRALSEEVTGQVHFSSWLCRWQELNRISQEHIQDYVSRKPIREGQAIVQLQKALPEQSAVFVGNSMPVRDLDTFFHVDQKNIRIMANRGANGIDGVISTALGASVKENHLVLVLGDLSFFHDLNGLLMAKLYRLNITIIVINNEGGGIFSFLPQADCGDNFEKLFGTPLGLDFSHAVQMYGGTFLRIPPDGDLAESFKEYLPRPGLKVLEIISERRENAVLHRDLWQSLGEKLNRLFGQE